DEDQRGFVWAGLHDPGPDEIAHVAEVFDLHPLAVEDAIKARQRPKVERYGPWLFVVLKTGRYLDEPEEVEFGEIQLFVGPDAVVVLRRGEPVPLGTVRRRLEADPDRLASGPVAVLHGVLDEVVDAYQLCLSGLDDDVNEVELEVFSEHTRGQGSRLVERMYFLQRELLELHRALQPLGDGMAVLRTDPTVTGADDWPSYFRDVTDHLRRQQDQLAGLRDLLNAALAANATQVSLRQNEDMRRISAWVAIVAVPTMIAGIYGMNFEHMPELEWVAGYPLSLAVMVAISGTLYRLFRRSGWL
ncbi:MAG TPA: magnesium and cobalt transport protein CorA, partial [Acidimicrobiales bacterium]|nr:magnesium and cobalt transport protein CorA [Acidimicrobiales bacterium]